MAGSEPALRLDSERKSLRLTGPLKLNGRLRIPGDKSISHRAILFASIADGESHISNLAPGDDVAATRRMIRTVGVSARPDGSALDVTGRGFEGLSEPAAIIYCANSGTTMRLGAGLLAGRPAFAILNGDDSLRVRPMARIIQPLCEMGAKVSGAHGNQFPPLVVRGGGLHGVSHSVPVASAQVKGAVVLAGLQASGETTIEMPGPTRDHTERILKELGAEIEATDDNVVVRPSQPRAFELEVPGDISSAAFLIAAAAVCPGSEITLEKVGVNPSRRPVLDSLEEMGVDIEVGKANEVVGEPVADITVRYSPRLRAISEDGPRVGLLIDEIPVLAVLGAVAEGESSFSNAAELRTKESDRIETVSSELRALGVSVREQTDGLAVEGGALNPGRVSSRGDHRLGMALAAVLAGQDGESVIEGIDAAAVSYPGFVADLATLAGLPDPYENDGG